MDIHVTKINRYMFLHLSLKSQFCENYECYKEAETVDKEDWEEVDGSVIDYDQKLNDFQFYLSFAL